MTSLEAYQNLLLKVNRNDSNSNINVPRGQFVLIFNEQLAKWTCEKVQKKLSSEELDELNDLLEDEKELVKISSNRNYDYFAIPENFYKVSSSYSIANRDGCERILTNWNLKSPDARVILNDENSNPSFDFEETPMFITQGRAKIYFSDFTIEKAFLSYYRTPSPIDIEGYINLDGTLSKNIDPDISEANVNEIVTRCAAEIMRNNQNVEGLNLQKDRIPYEN
jgi:hypothetical protein